ncbi:hypothetical protein Mesop_1500 [Mesorhizobium opportunistum WSM2075]|uniref:Lytic murein transglycosylase n=1 Tax=Mesorhizobium opportunistum (strain LMG 24607 / HAMBI 3007 / WSM2075) TaxID=536019 RepID=F7Y0R3_MESOW|nr:hypothetical protein Mesop_1500 [Mesorhizobium opportunistum WSM2075]
MYFQKKGSAGRRRCLLLVHPEASRDSTPLRPAGHLPRKEGDWQFMRPASLESYWRLAKAQPSLISPLAGEMSGRTEGGVKELDGGIVAGTALARL